MRSIPQRAKKLPPETKTLNRLIRPARILPPIPKRSERGKEAITYGLMSREWAPFEWKSDWRMTRRERARPEWRATLSSNRRDERDLRILRKESLILYRLWREVWQTTEED